MPADNTLLNTYTAETDISCGLTVTLPTERTACIAQLKQLICQIECGTISPACNVTEQPLLSMPCSHMVISLNEESDPPQSYLTSYCKTAEALQPANITIPAKTDKEQRLRQAMNIAGIGCWEHDFAKGVANWSAETCRIFGIATTENKHTLASWMAFVHPEDRDRATSTLINGRNNGKDYDFYYRIIRPDGQLRHIYTLVQLDKDANGVVTGAYGVSQDVTKIKKAEDALKQSEANLRMIMDLVPQSIFAKDYDGRYLFANKNFADMYGLDPADLVNKRMSDTIPVATESAAFMEQDREVILTGTSKVIPEQTFTDFRGNKRVFQTVKVPFTIAGSGERAVLGVTMDVTELRNAEDERMKMITDILQRNTDLEHFSYIVSHNLRAPVANIIGLTDVLKTGALNARDEKEFMDGLDAAATNLDNIVQDLNTILQVKYSEGYKKEPVKLSGIMDDVKDCFKHIIDTEAIQLTGNFAAAPEIVSVKNYIYSVFLNLISNSIKYRRPDEQLCIEVSAAREAGKTILSFKDNGQGIDLNKYGHQVFGLYRQFHRNAKGKGMGLYMTKAYITLLGGKISVQSEVNKGSAFVIEFENI